MSPRRYKGAPDRCTEGGGVVHRSQASFSSSRRSRDVCALRADPGVPHLHALRWLSSGSSLRAGCVRQLRLLGSRDVGAFPRARVHCTHRAASTLAFPARTAPSRLQLTPGAPTLQPRGIDTRVQSSAAALCVARAPHSTVGWARLDLQALSSNLTWRGCYLACARRSARPRDRLVRLGDPPPPPPVCGPPPPPCSHKRPGVPSPGHLSAR
jgi:hypothetical protein